MICHGDALASESVRFLVIVPTVWSVQPVPAIAVRSADASVCSVEANAVKALPSSASKSRCATTSTFAPSEVDERDLMTNRSSSVSM